MIAAHSSALEELLNSQPIDIVHTWNLDDGWSCVQFFELDNSDEALPHLAGALGTPVVGATFLDSDFAFVDGITGPGRTWSGYLRPKLAEEYEMPVEDFSLETELAGALAWSAAAGLVPDEALIRRALTDDEGYAEELFHVLLAGLGIPGATIPE